MRPTVALLLLFCSPSSPQDDHGAALVAEAQGQLRRAILQPRLVEPAAAAASAAAAAGRVSPDNAAAGINTQPHQRQQQLLAQRQQRQRQRRQQQRHGGAATGGGATVISLPGSVDDPMGLKNRNIITLAAFVAEQTEAVQLAAAEPRTHKTKGAGYDGTGGQIWMSALLLQAYLSSSTSSITSSRRWRGGRSEVEGRRCIELGTGTGIVAIAAARLGASFVAATDGNPVMVALSLLNARTSLTPLQLDRFAAAEYLWGGVVPSFDLGGRATLPASDGADIGRAAVTSAESTFDTVLLTDLLYSKAGIPSLLSAVDSVCVPLPARCTVLIAYQRRDYGQMGELLGHRDLAGRFAVRS